MSLSAQAISVAFPQAGGARKVLQDVSLTLAPGEFLSIIGPSGCGKTTLLRALAGLVPVSSGRVDFKGKPVTQPRRDLAVVFQDYGKALLPWRTVRANVELALQARGIASQEFRPRVDRLLEQTGLNRHAELFPSQLSGGLQQRVQIARCLALEPGVLLMDEPFGALDAMTRQTLQDEVLRLRDATGITVLFITHDLEEAIYMGDRVIALAAHPGRIARQWTVSLGRERHQLHTREQPEFLRLRHELFELIQGLSRAAA
jgi:NitT/TauT family transport system ATP-binding protein